MFLLSYRFDSSAASAVTVEKEAKKAALEYVKECVAVDMYAASLVKHEAFS